MSDNPPRAYNLDDPAELLRLHRECYGYLRTCHYKHGTDWDGRRFAIEALGKLAQWPDKPSAVLPSQDR